jgi:hypothetical protein
MLATTVSKASRHVFALTTPSHTWLNFKASRTFPAAKAHAQAAKAVRMVSVSVRDGFLDSFTHLQKVMRRDLHYFVGTTEIKLFAAGN